MTRVELLDTMGDDLRAVNAARISHDRWKDTFDDKDARLIGHLSEGGENSPFYHPKAMFRITVPFFMARQLRRNHVGLDASPLVWADSIVDLDDFADANDIDRNEVSRRYTSSEPEFEAPREWRKAGTAGNPQVSGDAFGIDDQVAFTSVVNQALGRAQGTYEALLRRGVAPEQARVVLPVCTLTTWLWTGSLFAYAKLCRERLTPDAQPETREVAQQIADAMAEAFPVSWAALMGG